MTQFKTMTDDFLPTRKAIIGPTNGWKPQTYYQVKVAFNAHNPIHLSIFYSGFLHEGKPAGYNQVWNPSYEQAIPSEEIYYMEVIGELIVSIHTKLFGNLEPGDNIRLENDHRIWQIITKPTKEDESDDGWYLGNAAWLCEAVTTEGKTDILRMSNITPVEIV